LPHRARHGEADPSHWGTGDADEARCPAVRLWQQAGPHRGTTIERSIPRPQPEACARGRDSTAPQGRSTTVSFQRLAAMDGRSERPPLREGACPAPPATAATRHAIIASTVQGRVGITWWFSDMAVVLVQAASRRLESAASRSKKTGRKKDFGSLVGAVKVRWAPRSGTCWPIVACPGPAVVGAPRANAYSSAHAVDPQRGHTLTERGEEGGRAPGEGRNSGQPGARQVDGEPDGDREQRRATPLRRGRPRRGPAARPRVLRGEIARQSRDNSRTRPHSPANGGPLAMEHRSGPPRPATHRPGEVTRILGEEIGAQGPDLRSFASPPQLSRGGRRKLQHVESCWRLRRNTESLDGLAPPFFLCFSFFLVLAEGLLTSPRPSRGWRPRRGTPRRCMPGGRRPVALSFPANGRFPDDSRPTRAGVRSSAEEDARPRPPFPVVSPPQRIDEDLHGPSTRARPREGSSPRGGATMPPTLSAAQLQAQIARGQG